MLSHLDYLIIAIFILLNIALVAISSRGPAKSALEDMLLGRKLTLPMLVMTMVSTWYGGIFGVTQIAFKKGLYNFVIQGVVWYVAYILYAIFLVPRIYRSGFPTISDIVRQRYGRIMMHIFSIYLLLKLLPVSYSLAIGVIGSFFFNVDFAVAALVGTLFVSVYCSIGGFRAVVYTDCLQFIAMFAASLGLLLYSWFNLGDINYLAQHIPAGHLSINLHADGTMFVVWFAIAFATTTLSPAFYQRAMAAESSRVASKGIMLSLLFWLVFDLSTTFGAMYALAYMPGAEAKTAYLEFGVSFLPTGMRGLFIAGIIATVLSTIDSFTYLCEKLVTYNIMGYKGISARRSFVVNLILGLVSALLAVYFDGDIERYWLTMEKYTTSIVALPVLLAIWYCTRKGSAAVIKNATIRG
jgi:SSS family solute:Na+ symporter